MLQILLKKELFEDIISGREKTIIKKFSKYWQKELLDIKIINDKITYSINKPEKIKIINTLGSTKPQVIIECLKVNYNKKESQFEFLLGVILEQKNINTIDFRDELIKKLEKEKKDLENAMNKDFLTSLYTRQKLETDLDSFVNRLDSDVLTAVFIDADKFKNINDRYGHDAGDEVLKFLAQKLKNYALLLNGQAYRYGGEEFILLCFMEKNKLLNILDKLRIEIKTNKINNVNKDIRLTVSMGLSFWKDFSNKKDFINKADEYLYKAKNEGRDKIVYF